MAVKKRFLEGTSDSFVVLLSIERYQPYARVARIDRYKTIFSGGYISGNLDA